MSSNPKKPKKEDQPEGAEESDQLDTTAETPEPHIPNEVAPTPQHTDAATDKHKPRHTDSFDEVYVGPGEKEILPDEALPDVFALLGKKDDIIPIEDRGDGYHTEMVQGAGDINLIWHPAIVCGRCELCGSSRYVGGEVWKQIERKTGEVKYKYRGGRWMEISAKNCPHYRQVKIACSYCREEFTGAKDRLDQFSEVLGSRVLFVVSEPGRPKSLIMVCSDFKCKNKFNDQFHINNR